MPSRFQRSASVAAVTALLGSVPAEGLTIPASRPGRQYSAVAAGSRRGRPRKFGRPSRAVTMTLPDDVISALQSIDQDLSRAIVRAVQGSALERSCAPAELARYGGGDQGDQAVIIVSHCRALKAWTGVELVPLTDGRALLSFDDHLSVPEFELRLLDAIEDPALEEHDRAVFRAVVEILRSTRRESGDIELRQRRIIVLHTPRLSGETPDRSRKPRALAG